MTITQTLMRHDLMGFIIKDLHNTIQVECTQPRFMSFSAQSRRALWLWLSGHLVTGPESCLQSEAERGREQLLCCY